MEMNKVVKTSVFMLLMVSVYFIGTLTGIELEADKQNQTCAIEIFMEMDGVESGTMIPIKSDQCGQLEYMCSIDDKLWTMIGCENVVWLTNQETGAGICFCDQTIKEEGVVRV